MSEIVLIGTNHNFSPLKVREKITFDNERLDRYLNELKGIDCME